VREAVVMLTPSPRYSGERAGERGERRSTSMIV